MENLNTHKKLNKYIDSIKKLVIESELLKHSKNIIKNGQKNINKKINLNNASKKDKEIINEFFLDTNTDNRSQKNILNKDNTFEKNNKKIYFNNVSQKNINTENKEIYLNEENNSNKEIYFNEDNENKYLRDSNYFPKNNRINYNNNYSEEGKKFSKKINNILQKISQEKINQKIQNEIINISQNNNINNKNELFNIMQNAIQNYNNKNQSNIIDTNNLHKYLNKYSFNKQKKQKTMNNNIVQVPKILIVFKSKGFL